MNAALATFLLPPNLPPVAIEPCVVCGRQAIEICVACSEGLNKYGKPSPT
jgi:hypothetical protein